MRYFFIITSIASFLFLTNASFAQSSPYTEAQPAYKWYIAGQQTVAKSTQLSPSQKRAKNIILFVGDGMGISTITAARILQGQQQKQAGEEAQLSFEKFPYVALSKTYNVNQQVPDSAGTATAMLTGVKTNAGVLSVDETVKLSDFKQVPGHTLKTLFEEAEDWGMATGIVATARITHATPAAGYAHTSHRDWESDSQLPEAAKKAGVADIALQLIEFPHGDGINLILGGGRNYFLPKAEQQGIRADERNLVKEWEKKYPDGVFVDNNKGFDAIDWKKTNHVLGLFNGSHMNHNADRNNGPEGEPALSDMTAKAITFLSRNPQGYVLLVEAGRIDHAHHEGNAYRALTDTIELSKAVEIATKMTSDQDTLIIVTADHSHVMSMNGYPVRGNPILGKVMEWNETTGELQMTKDKNGLPYTTLQYANGPGARERVDLSNIDTTNPEYLQDALIPLESETHGGEDVAVFAQGPGAQWVHGVMEQNVIYHIIREALGR